MILRMWRARADRGREAGYPEHFRRHVVPALQQVAGFLGADLASRELEDGVEFTVCTRWASMDAVRGFAGAEPERAVVEPAAVATLAAYDDHVTHHVVVQQVVPSRDRA